MSDHPSRDTDPLRNAEERLERGDVIYFPKCPFPLPAGDDLAFLLRQQLGRVHKNISYDPAVGRAGGFARTSAEDAERLRELFAAFSRTTTEWLARMLPRYSQGWQLDRISYRPEEEEATRRLRHLARNDLLHVDAFPGRPSQGRRILRVFANVNPAEPRIWVTSSPFAALLEQYGAAAGLPTRNSSEWVAQLREGVLRLFRPGQARRSAYDSFMLRFHDYLKMNEEFQERGPKRLWTFPPGCAWIAITDTCSHSVLRGRYALEHSYFVSPRVLAIPDESPPALLERACARQASPRAA